MATKKRERPSSQTTNRNEVTARTEEQARYLDAITKNDITLCSGVAGSGKTYLAVGMAVKLMLSSESTITKLAIARPIVEAGEKMGHLPGDLIHKCAPYMVPIMDALTDFLSRQEIEKLEREGKLEVAPLAYMRGRTFKNSFVILDEAQNATVKQLKMLLTRLGHGSKIVVNGDNEQFDIHDSGLTKVIEMYGDIHGIAAMELTEVSIQRHPLVAAIIRRDRELTQPS